MWPAASPAVFVQWPLGARWGRMALGSGSGHHEKFRAIRVINWGCVCAKYIGKQHERPLRITSHSVRRIHQSRTLVSGIGFFSSFMCWAEKRLLEQTLDWAVKNSCVTIHPELLGWNRTCHPDCNKCRCWTVKSLQLIWRPGPRSSK